MIAGAAAPGGDEGLLADVTCRIRQVLAQVTDMGTAVTAAAAAAGPRLLRLADLAAVPPLADALLRRHEGFAAGAGVVLAPGALADAARRIEWWWADEDAGLHPLEVDLDPDSAVFYDYTTAQWYREPARTGAPSVTGPYVDYLCTHECTITLTTPMVHRGRFLGVAGADVLASQVERMVLPGLVALRRPAALVNRDGRVIASNTARVPPGVAVAGPPVGVHAGYGPAWRLVDLGPREDPG